MCARNAPFGFSSSLLLAVIINTFRKPVRLSIDVGSWFDARKEYFRNSCTDRLRKTFHNKFQF
jgi:hypothetical protein